MSRIAVLSTGGTIASRQDSSGASAAGDGVAAMPERLPCQLDVPVGGRDVCCIGSDLLAPTDMAAIVRVLADDSVVGVVATYGTDTMEVTGLLAGFRDQTRVSAELVLQVRNSSGARRETCQAERSR